MAENKTNDDNDDDLITATSLALSLSAPRAPPHGSIHRDVYYLGKTRRKTSKEVHHTFLDRFHVPHPHLPMGIELGDRITRAIGSHLPLSWQNKLRDNGSFRSIADSLITVSAPFMALSNPKALTEFMKLSRDMTRIPYGVRHPMQEIHLFENGFDGDDGREGFTHRGLVFFVHGGAWGSGLPWMYRLIASPFLSIGMSVAIVGYRTYPDADVDGQVQDLQLAMDQLVRSKPHLFQNGVCIMGHSSGAHIALLMLLERIRHLIHIFHPEEDDPTPYNNPSSLHFTVPIRSFVGLSGPYSISHHFDYEAHRGVEEISPMKPACGYSRTNFDRNSPPARLQHLLTSIQDEDAQHLEIFIRSLPRMLLVHGMEDSTVPFTATAEAARILRACGTIDVEECYIGKTGHETTVMHLMLGGKTCDEVVKWLVRDTAGSGNFMAPPPIQRVIHQSRL